jgi:hypothetical protein
MLGHRRAAIQIVAQLPETQADALPMDNGAVICVFETPDDIAERTKNR